MATTTTERLLSELNNKTKQGFHNLCCKLENLNPAKDYELFIACDSITNNPVIVAYGYDTNGVLTINYTNIDGTPASNDVVRCPSISYELTNFQWFCNNATSEEVSRTDLYVDGIFDSYIWQDINGTVISAPSSNDLTIGKCEQIHTLNTVNPVDLADKIDANFRNNVNSENYVGVNAERDYVNTVRIISDSEDIHRVENSNPTTEVLNCCYQINFTGSPQKGFLVIKKNHLGVIFDQYIVSQTGGLDVNQALTNANLADCQESVYDYTSNIVPISCYLQLDNINPVSGFSFKKGCFVKETTTFSNNATTVVSVVYDSDLKTVITDDVFLINCPELICLEQDGTIFKGYVININGTSINNNTSINLTLYYDENLTALDNLINPITIVDCDDNIYNNVTHYLVDDTAPLIINANKAHSISYNVLRGTVNVTIDTTTLPYIQGESSTDIATQLINQEYTFTPQTGGLVKVRVIN